VLLVLNVPTAGSTMKAMRRALWWMRTSGLPVVALWLVGDAPLGAEARNRREQSEQEKIDGLRALLAKVKAGIKTSRRCTADPLRAAASRVLDGHPARHRTSPCSACVSLCNSVRF
jgi:hypothetical protein